MNITMIVCSAVPEVVWNAFRLANIMLEEMEDVSIFLNGPAVRYADWHSDALPLLDVAKLFTLSEGNLLA